MSSAPVAVTDITSARADPPVPGSVASLRSASSRVSTSAARSGRSRSVAATSGTASASTASHHSSGPEAPSDSGECLEQGLRCPGGLRRAPRRVSAGREGSGRPRGWSAGHRHSARRCRRHRVQRRPRGLGVIATGTAAGSCAASSLSSAVAPAPPPAVRRSWRPTGASEVGGHDLRRHVVDEVELAVDRGGVHDPGEPGELVVLPVSSGAAALQRSGDPDVGAHDVRRAIRACLPLAGALRRGVGHASSDHRDGQRERDRLAGRTGDGSCPECEHQTAGPHHELGEPEQQRQKCQHEHGHQGEQQKTREATTSGST